MLTLNLVCKGKSYNYNALSGLFGYGAYGVFVVTNVLGATEGGWGVEKPRSGYAIIHPPRTTAPGEDLGQMSPERGDAVIAFTFADEIQS